MHTIKFNIQAVVTVSATDAERDMVLSSDTAKERLAADDRPPYDMVFQEMVHHVVGRAFKQATHDRLQSLGIRARISRPECTALDVDVVTLNQLKEEV